MIEVWPPSLLSPKTALVRYERMSARPRSYKAWRALQRRLLVAASRTDEHRALYLLELALECKVRAFEAKEAP